MGVDPGKAVRADTSPPARQDVSGQVFDIQRFSIHDGPGIRTIVFFKTCPLRCIWCSNPESQQAACELLFTRSRCLDCDLCVSACPAGVLSRSEGGIVIARVECDGCGKCADVCPNGAMRLAGRRLTAGQVLEEVARDLIFYDHSAGGMTLSGGEPLAQPDFALALLQGASRRSIHTAVETSGSASANTVRRVLGATDLILFDIKQVDLAKHRAATKKGNERILKNARLAASLRVPMIVRVPVIPGFNDTPEEIAHIGQFALEIGIADLHLLPYHRYGLAKYAALGREYELVGASTPPPSQIQALASALQNLGLHVSIVG